MDQQEALPTLTGKRAADDGGDEPNKRPRTAEAKKLEDRVLANRRSARRSRERRKQLQGSLEKSVILLTRQNEDLSRENLILKQELRDVCNEKRNLPGAVHPALVVSNLFPGGDNSTSNMRLELQRRMAAQSGGLFPGNSYAANLATSMHQNVQIQPEHFMSGAGQQMLQGAGQQMFNYANRGHYMGQGNSGMM